MHKAIRTVIAMLPQDRQASEDELVRSLAAAQAMCAVLGEQVDPQELERESRAKVAVWQDTSISLVDNTDHIEWLTDAKTGRTWEFWERYERYLLDVQELPP